MSVELTTNVRFPRSRLWGLVFLVPVILAAILAGRFTSFWFFILPGPFVFRFFRNRVVRASVVASEAGLRIGERLVPRHCFTGAFVRHDGERTYVALHGDERIDVEVPNNVEADAVLKALHLDATSAAVDVSLRKNPSSFVSTLAPITVFLVVTEVAKWFHYTKSWDFFIAGAAAFMTVALLRLAHGVVLRVGADGIVFHEALKRPRFVSHDAIADVSAEDDSITIAESNGRKHVLTIPGRRNDSRESRNAAAAAERADEAQAIVRRIRQARQAFREGANAPELTVALDQGSRSVRDWIADLRRLGEGAASTFRTIGVAREQLFDVVESTTAAAKERIAALVALRSSLREEDKPRIRVAAQRIAAPELRERMVRILDAEDDAAVEAELRSLEEED